MNLNRFLASAPKVKDFKDVANAAELIDKFNSNDSMGRVTLELTTWSTTGDYGIPAGVKSVAEVRPPLESNVISSMLPNGNHAPVLDIDISHKLKPSSTPGHGHLFLDVELTTKQYDALLSALVEAGVVERGVLESFRNLGFTCARIEADKFEVQTTANRPGSPWKLL